MISSRYAFKLIGIAVLVLLFSSCAGTKRTRLPLYSWINYIRVPAQQLLMADSVDQAVNQLSLRKTSAISSDSAE